MAAVFRSRLHLQRRPGYKALHGDLAEAAGWHPLLHNRQPHAVLRTSHDPHIHVLRAHLDQSVATRHTQRHEGRHDGEATAEVQGQGRQDAHNRSHSVCPVVATALRYFRAHQARG